MKTNILKVITIGLLGVSLLACGHTEDTILTKNNQLEKQENEVHSINSLNSEGINSEDTQFEKNEVEKNKIEEQGKEIKNEPISTPEVE